MIEYLLNVLSNVVIGTVGAVAFILSVVSLEALITNDYSWFTELEQDLKKVSGKKWKI